MLIAQTFSNAHALDSVQVCDATVDEQNWYCPSHTINTVVKTAAK